MPPDWTDAREASDAYMLGSLLLFLCTGASLQILVFQNTPNPFKPGVWMGAFDQVYTALQAIQPATAPAWVALEQVRDPGNLGTMLRTGDAVGAVPDCGVAETEAAIAAANAAWPEWRRRTAVERAALLEAWHALVLANLDDLARIMSAEQGKPFPEAQGEIRYAATFIKWFAEEGRRIGGRNVP
jgi:delta 1-pyrroline-5-carboxylate dehydrogenase